QVGERGMALGDFAGAQAVDGAGGNAEWPETPRYRGVARVRFQADQAQRQGGADFGGAERSEWGDGVDGSAQIARYHDVAGAQALGLFQRQSAVGFEIEAQAPFAIDPDAMARRGAAQRFGKLAVAIPMLIIDGGERQAKGQLEGEAGGQPLGTQARC